MCVIEQRAGTGAARKDRGVIVSKNSKRTAGGLPGEGLLREANGQDREWSEQRVARTESGQDRECSGQRVARTEWPGQRVVRTESGQDREWPGVHVQG